MNENKKYIVTFSDNIMRGLDRTLTVSAVDTDDAQDVAIETLEKEGVVVPSIRTIKRLQ